MAHPLRWTWQHTLGAKTLVKYYFYAVLLCVVFTSLLVLWCATAPWPISTKVDLAWAPTTVLSLLAMWAVYPDDPGIPVCVLVLAAITVLYYAVLFSPAWAILRALDRRRDRQSAMPWNRLCLLGFVQLLFLAGNVALSFWSHWYHMEHIFG